MMDDGELDYYEVLGVGYSASAEEIKRSYHRLARKFHPDMSSSHQSAEQFSLLHAAWKVLGDTHSRSAYDLEIRARIQSYHNALNRAEESSLAEFEQSDEHSWRQPCRCGDFFYLTDEETASEILLIPCDGCSLHIKLVNPFIAKE